MNELLINKCLDDIIARAKGLGYEVRHEVMDGIGSSFCVIRGKKCLFLDLSCGSAEQLESLRNSLDRL